jgi:hypothetical protein
MPGAAGVGRGRECWTAPMLLLNICMHGKAAQESMLLHTLHAHTDFRFDHMDKTLGEIKIDIKTDINTLSNKLDKLLRLLYLYLAGVFILQLPAN